MVYLVSVATHARAHTHILCYYVGYVDQKNPSLWWFSAHWHSAKCPTSLQLLVLYTVALSVLLSPDWQPLARCALPPRARGAELGIRVLPHHRVAFRFRCWARHFNLAGHTEDMSSVQDVNPMVRGIRAPTSLQNLAARIAKEIRQVRRTWNTPELICAIFAVFEFPTVRWARGGTTYCPLLFSHQW